MGFFTRGTAVPGNAGKGFLIDNATSISSSTLTVDDDGVQCPGGFPTIQAAVNSADSGDTIQVCAGTYPENVSTNKNLNFRGPQAGVDARTGRTNPSAEAVVGIASGAFNLQVNPGTTTVDGFTLTGANTSNGDGAALLLINGTGHQVINNIFVANQRGAFFDASNTTFRRNRLNNTFDGFFGGGNNATIQENAFIGAYPDGAINTTHSPQSSNYRIIDNTFNATGNFIVAFNTNNGLISGNAATGTSNTVVFIGGGNNNLVVESNTITGNTSSAIGLSDVGSYPADSNITIRSNNLINNLRGIRIGSAASATTGIEIHFNRIIGNTAFGILNDTATAVNAENNWWGCNYGPGATGAGCSGTTNSISGNIDANPWLTLRTTATPSTVMQGGTSNILSNLNTNSGNVSTSGFIPNGTPANFAATLGTVSPTASMTNAGVTGTTFTAGSTVGTGGVQTTVDGQTVNAPITVVFTCNNITLPAITNVPRNSQFTVPITVDSVTGRGILSYTFRLNYNAATVTPILVDNAGTISSAMSITVNSTPGALLVTASGTSPLVGSGTLLNIRFLATSGIGTNSPLSFGSFEFNEGEPCVNTGTGVINVISGTISGTITYSNAGGPPAGPTLPVFVPNATLNAAGSVPVSTTTATNGTYSLSGLGAGAYTVTPSKTGNVNGITGFDSARISQHVVNLITLNPTQLLAADVSGNGTVTAFDASLISQYVVNIPNSSSTGTWRFSPVSRSYSNVETDQTTQDYGAILMGDVSGNWNPSAPNQRAAFEMLEKDRDLMRTGAPIIVNAPANQLVSPGAITIPITVDDTSGQGIISYQFDLSFNQNVITPQAVPCEVAGTISSSLSVTCNRGTPGLLEVTVSGSMPISGMGTLLNLKFNAVGTSGTSSLLTFSDFMFNEGVPQGMANNGRVTISSPTAATSSISGTISNSMEVRIPNALVTLTDSAGGNITTLANSKGKFIFRELPVGEIYTITISAKGYTFSPQVVNTVNNLHEVIFTALP